MTTTVSAFRLQTLSESEVRQILTWRYAAPYDYYDPPEPTDVEAYISRFSGPDYDFHSVRDEENRFVGFCSFGTDGQVAGGDYEDGPLDLGLGMNPNIAGQGRGSHFVAAIVNYAFRLYQPTALRLSVAEFNERAIKVYRKRGFVITDEFVDLLGTPHLMMQLSSLK